MNQKEWEETIAWSKVVAGCVIKNDEGKYLLVKEKQPKVYGLWNVPAGHVDKGESIEQAAVREVKEETGYDIELGGKIKIYHESIDAPIKHAFRANIIGGELKIQPDEILDAKWLSYEEITELNSTSKIRSEWIFDAISLVENEDSIAN